MKRKYESTLLEKGKIIEKKHYIQCITNLKKNVTGTEEA